MVTPTQTLPLFSRRLKAARKRMGITQMELGVRAGIDEFSSSARINQYERGKHIPDYLTAKHLAKVLGVPPAFFYAEDEHLADLIACFGQLKSSERKELLDLAGALLNRAKSGKGK